MLYKFKSRASADVILLEAQARDLLEIIGKRASEPKGIITVAQLPAALKALHAAQEASKAHSKFLHQEAHAEASDDDGHAEPAFADEHVSLGHRAVPFIDMLTEALKQNVDVVWGV